MALGSEGLGFRVQGLGSGKAGFEGVRVLELEVSGVD